MVAPKRGFCLLSTSQSAAPVVTVGSVKFGNDLPISIIAGPCQLESRAHALEVASALKEIAGRLKIGLVYKTSFDKANRTSATTGRGIGLELLAVVQLVFGGIGEGCGHAVAHAGTAAKPDAERQQCHRGDGAPRRPERQNSNDHATLVNRQS